MNKITDHEVLTAVHAIRAGSDQALAEFVERYDSVISGLARKAPMEDKEDARSIATLALISALRETPVGEFEEKAAATMYVIVKNATLDEAAQDRTVSIPNRTSLRYAAILRDHDGDMTAAYAAVSAGSTDMDPTSFLAAHMATYAHLDRESISTAPVEDEDHPAFQIAVEDDLDAVDTFDLVHRHLFPLIDEEGTHDLDIVKLVYGFPQISDRLVDALSDAGFQPGDVLSDIETAEVLAAPGLGSRTVGKRRRASLAKMREYLEIDAANENN